jgi:hypothetical protein
MVFLKAIKKGEKLLLTSCKKMMKEASKASEYV